MIEAFRKAAQKNGALAAPARLWYDGKNKPFSQKRPPDNGKERIAVNTPALETERLILRKWERADIDALFALLRDEEVNTFLPWFPVKSREEAERFYEERFASQYQKPCAYHYAVCLKKDGVPAGYVNLSGIDGARDLGYGLCKALWHQGIVTEACRAVIAQLKKDGIPFVTATHDVNNPRSGGVMQNLGMQYQYSYEVLVQPKNVLVTFRLYQLNLDGDSGRVYREYWDASAVHYVEQDVRRPGTQKQLGRRNSLDM